MRIVVDLPAPFGPRSPTHVPAGTSRSRPSTAVIGPKRLTTPRNRMARSVTFTTVSPGARTETGGSHTILGRVVVPLEDLFERQAVDLAGEHPQAPEVRDDGDVAPGAQLRLDLRADDRDTVEDVAQALPARHPLDAVVAPQPQLALSLEDVLIGAVVDLLEPVAQVQRRGVRLGERARGVDG